MKGALSKKRQRMAKATARLPRYLAHVVTTKARRPRLQGTFGPAGPVTIIKPSDGQP